jgi:hypothetical protein
MCQSSVSRHTLGRKTPLNSIHGGLNRSVAPLCIWGIMTISIIDDY